ncbi:MAG: hypothetical protein JXQ75_14190 [Phycisphaerae bacterium]|nr:hypothetical protein [Phycisphaerae bacterium]
MANNQNTPDTQDYESKGAGTQVPFDAINEPGTYVCNWSGHLLRVPADSIKVGRSPLMNLTGTHPLYVCKISNDPFIPLTKARMLAANYDWPVNF